MESELDITKLIHRGGIFVDVEGNSPKEIYETISKRIELPEGISAEQISSALNAREMVLSTAVGNAFHMPEPL